MTCHEAITKINNYKSKLRVMGVPCHFDFAVRKVADFGDEGYREAFFKATAGVVMMGE